MIDAGERARGISGMHVSEDRLEDRLPSLVRAHPMFADLDEAAVATLIDGGRIVDYAEGDTLLHQGGDSDSALLLLEGRIAVVAETEFGSVTLAELSGVCLLGEVGVYAQLPRSATLRALTPARALATARDAMLRVGQDHPAILLRVIQQLAGRLNAFNQAIATYADALSALDTETDDSRIIDALLAPPPELTNFAGAFRKMATFIRQQRQQRQEMANAAAIQNALLPFPLPTDPERRFRLDAVIKPARRVGGDFFDAFRLGADDIVVTIGDVSGKGVAASLFATVCQMVMRLVLRETSALGEAVARANDLIVTANREGMFATFFVAHLDLRDGVLRFCNAGHVWPIVRRADGRCDYLRGHDLPLAVMDEATYTEERTTLRAGERLILCTDGVLEAVDVADAEFGQERLAAIAADLPATTTAGAQAILAAVERFCEGTEQFDDIACLVLDYDGRVPAKE